MIIDSKCLDGIVVEPILESLKLQKIDDSEYFSSKYSSYISNSRLSLINPYQDDDPKAFFEGLSKHNKYSDALVFGSAVHELVLQPELFHLCEEVDRPTAKLGFMADELYPVFTNILDGEMDLIYEASNKIDYYKDKLNKDRIDFLIEKCKDYWSTRRGYESRELKSIPIYLDPKSRERVQQCVFALKSNKAISELLHPSGLLNDPISENEQAILLDVIVNVPGYDQFILKIKAKLDNYTIDSETNTITVNDVKTIGKIVSEFPNNFDKFHYYRELALYSWLLSLVAKTKYGLTDCTIKSNCLVVSTIPSYYTKVYKVTKEDFNRGWLEFKFLLKLVAYYYSKGYRFE